MTSRTMKWVGVSVLLLASGLGGASRTAFASITSELRFIQVAAVTKEDRSAVVNQGVSIEAVRSDSVWGFASANAIRKLEAGGFKITGNYDLSTGRGGHENLFGFPPEDSKFHTYDQMVQALQDLNKKNPDITRLSVIGKSIEGRDIWAVHFNTSKEALDSGLSSKPGAIFMGNHHAREHVSVEIPLMLMQYLMDNRRDPRVSALLDTRDIWVVPMVNPDGVEYDITDGDYKMWRKNRRNNGDGTYGVDLNRNYGFKWGTGGSDTDTSSDIYMGTAPFSEPETQAIRDFVEAHLNAKVLLTFHTFSELVLYPWGHKYEPIDNSKDHAVFDKMARTMAGWNHYKPEQSSGLYIASGDTTDWAYGAHGIFAFTFELSPRDMWGGGFYPGEGVIGKVFQDNLKPCLYLLDVANDPYKVLISRTGGYLKNYVEPALPEENFWESNPIQE